MSGALGVIRQGRIEIARHPNLPSAQPYSTSGRADRVGPCRVSGALGVIRQGRIEIARRPNLPSAQPYSTSGAPIE